MNYEEIITLAKAGFNSTQIAQIANGPYANEDQIPAKGSVDLGTVEVVSEPPVTPTIPTPEAGDPSLNSVLLKELIGEVASLKKAIQTNNLQNSQQPPKQNADDVLAMIINPTYTHKEE